MAFPTSPTNGQITTKNGITYSYSSSTNSWTRITALQGGVFNTLRANIGIFTGNVSSASLSSVNMLEKVTDPGSALSGTYDYDCLTQSILNITSNATANFAINFRGSSATSLDSVLAVGQSISVVVLVTNGTTAYYPDTFQIDGTSITPKWQGGSAPTAGNASAIDVYTFTIIKTASATYTLLASQTKFA